MSVIVIQDRNEVHAGYILTVLETVNLEEGSDRGHCVFTVNPADSAQPDRELLALLENFQKNGEHHWDLEVSEHSNTWTIYGKDTPDLRITIPDEGRGTLSAVDGGDDRIEGIVYYTEEEDQQSDTPDGTIADDITVDIADQDSEEGQVPDKKTSRMIDLAAAVIYAAIIIMHLLIDYSSASYWFGRSWAAYPLFGMDAFSRLLLSIAGLFAYSVLFVCCVMLIRRRGRAMIPVVIGLLIVSIVCLSFMRADSSGDQDIARFCRGAEARLESAGVDPDQIRKWAGSMKSRKPGTVEVPLDKIPDSLRMHEPRMAKIDSMAGKAVFTFGPYSDAAWHYIVTWKTAWKKNRENTDSAERDYVTIVR